MIVKPQDAAFAAQEIPIVFSTDDRYAPYLDIAIASLIENASKSRSYRLIVLHTGLRADFMRMLRQNERPGFTIDFVDISKELEHIRARLKNIYHFSVVTYYRLFIASLFPQYDRMVYLDCDLVVLGDISELYQVELGDNILAAAPEQYVRGTKEFRRYAKEALGVEPDQYVNAGVLLINLKQFRRHQIEEQFIRLMTEYDFDLLDPDQAYLNYLCRNRIYEISKEWNREPVQPSCGGEKKIIHYALYKKPWQYSDVVDGEYFWQYAKRSPFYEEILRRRDAFGDKERAQQELAAKEILEHAEKIVASDVTFVKKLRG